MKKLFATIIIGLTLLFSLVGCSVQPQSVDTQNKVQQEKMLEEANKETGLPNIHNFFEKKMLKTVLELRDNPQLTTYVYTQNRDGQFIYVGRAIGFGIPYSTQYTNPDKIEHHGDASGGNISIPQADPNGLFSAEGQNATWIMMVNEDTNQPEIIYAEPDMVVTQSKLPKRLIASWSLPKNY